MEAEGKKPLDRKRVLIILLLLVSLGIGGWLFLKQDGFRFDSAAEDGSLDGLTKEQIQELMNDKVEEGQFMISINTQPVFADGKSEGTLRIENSPQNRYLMVVKIYLKEDGTEGEKIYESGAIRPGDKIETARLDVALKKGTYPVIAYFEAYDKKTKEFVGKAASTLTITIKE